MKRSRIIEICREAALQSEERHEYMPRDPHEKENFDPHWWIIEAVIAAVEESARRDHFAACAPINFDTAVKIFDGEAHMAIDGDRAAFMAVWAMASFEYADAMMEARK